MKVLVIGGTGFVSYFADDLQLLRSTSAQIQKAEDRA